MMNGSDSSSRISKQFVRPRSIKLDMFHFFYSQVDYKSLHLDGFKALKTFLIQSKRLASGYVLICSRNLHQALVSLDEKVSTHSDPLRVLRSGCRHQWGRRQPVDGCGWWRRASCRAHGPGIRPACPACRATTSCTRTVSGGWRARRAATTVTRNKEKHNPWKEMNKISSSITFTSIRPLLP